MSATSGVSSKVTIEGKNKYFFFAKNLQSGNVQISPDCDHLRNHMVHTDGLRGECGQSGNSALL